MEKQPLDYRSPGVPSQRLSKIAPGVVGGVVFLVNAILVAAAASDRSWGALGIAVAIGPIANLTTMVVALLSMIIVKWVYPETNLVPCGVVSVLLPLLAMPADFLIIASMGLHGC
jgi:hypothetical protein